MQKIAANCIDSASDEAKVNKALARSTPALQSIHFLETEDFKGYLGDAYFRSILSFSQTCSAARDISSDLRTRHALKILLTAVVEGNEALAQTIITSRPGLLLDPSAIVTDLSGKEIKALTPLQAAICAGDTHMVQMIHDVLQQKLQSGIQLSFDPESEMQRQFKAIYPLGIDSVKAGQKIKAQEFKNSMLKTIFNAINSATPEQVTFELSTPAHGTDGALSAALRNFREQFTAISKSDQIFNPWYLFMAYELRNETFNNFDPLIRRDLFWRQVIGYMQRHLPACYLQAFAQGIYVYRGEKLGRGFEFRGDVSEYMKPIAGDETKLGYNYAAMRDGRPGLLGEHQMDLAMAESGSFVKVVAQKDQLWKNYLRAESGARLSL